MINVKKNSSKLYVVLTIVFLVIMFLWFVLPYLFNGYFPYMRYHMMNGWMMPFGMIIMILVWISCIYLVLTFLDKRHVKPKVNSIDHLKNRLASGEISIEEYESIYQKIKENLE